MNLEDETRKFYDEAIRDLKVKLFDEKDKNERRELRRAIHSLELLKRRKVSLPGITSSD